MKVALIGTASNALLDFRTTFIKKLVARGCTVYAFAVDYTSDSEKKIKELGAVPVSYMLGRYGINPFSDIGNTLRLRRVLKDLRVDVAFSFFLKPVVFGTLAAKFSGVPHRVGMLEGLGYTFTDQPEGKSFKQGIIKFVQVLLYKISIPYLDRFIVLNSDDKKDLIDRYKIKANDVAVLGGIGLDLSQYPYTVPPKQKEINFTFVGRLLKEKGINYFLEAAEIIKDKFPNTTFTILGDTEPESSSSVSLDRLKSMCDDNIVTYPGQVENIPQWLQKCSVFVLPSYYREGVPRSSQEAMASGRPLITTDVPGCRETVENKRNGLLIPPCNVNALVDAMSFFIENPDQIEIMGIESNKMALEKFDSNEVDEKLYRLIMHN